MAIITTLTTEPSGAYAADLPTLLHSPGVLDYNYRWCGKSVPGSVTVGAPVSSWLSTKGDRLDAASSGTAPVLAVSNGIRCLAFDGVDDMMQLAALTQQNTVIVVLRVTAPTSTTVRMLGTTDADVDIQRTQYNGLALNAPGAANVVIGEANPTSWSFIGFWLDSSSGYLDFNSTVSAAAASTGGGVNSLRLGGTANGKFEIAEILTWSRILSGAERATVRAALKAAYPAMT